MGKLSVEEIRKLAEKVATEKLAPRASEIDQKRSFPWENICELKKAGLFGLGISEKEENFEFDRVCFATVVKEIAKACASTALVYVSHTIAYSDANRPPIPIQIGHPFRSKPATYSDPIRPVIPNHSGHPLSEISDAG